uniref:Uncharacterized protein n=1 Tax=Rhizophora mucronata TaxID=61149 RepID=A0A2P2N8P5_RHIMU
MQVSWFFE